MLNLDNKQCVDEKSMTENTRERVSVTLMKREHLSSSPKTDNYINCAIWEFINYVLNE